MILLMQAIPGASATSHQSVLLLDEQTNTAALEACAGLNERLLPHNADVFQADLVHLLQYEVYQKHIPQGQKFWIASEGSDCSAVDTGGKIAQVSCNHVLPALCTQSAILGAEPATQNQISVSSHGLTITG